MAATLPDGIMIMSTENQIPPELEHKFRSEAMCELQAELKQEIPERLEKKFQEKVAIEKSKENERES